MLVSALGIGIYDAWIGILPQILALSPPAASPASAASPDTRRVIESLAPPCEATVSNMRVHPARRRCRVQLGSSIIWPQSLACCWQGASALAIRFFISARDADVVRACL